MSARGFSRSPDRPFGEEPTDLPEYDTTFNSPDRRPDPAGREVSPYRPRMDPPDGNNYQLQVSSPQGHVDNSIVSRYESPVSSPHRVSDPDEISLQNSVTSSYRSYQSPMRNAEDERPADEEKSQSNASIDESLDESATIPISIDDSGRDTRSVASSQASSTRQSSIVSSILQKEFAESPSPRNDYSSPVPQESPIDISVDGTDEDNSKDEESLNEHETRLALMSPESTVTEGSAGSKSTYSRSKVLTGAQQILKKNREQRLQLMAKRRETQRIRTLKSPLEEDSSIVDVPPPPPPPPAGPRTPSRRSTSRSRARAAISPRSPATLESPPYSPASSTRSSRSRRLDSPPPAPISPRSPGTAYDSHDNYDTTSNASMASSGWTEDSDLNDRNSRRALILQMAKNRMKSGSKLET